MDEDKLLQQLMQKHLESKKVEENNDDDVDDEVETSNKNKEKEDKKVLLQNAEKEVVNLIVDSNDELHGFKIFGLFKFYLNDLKVKVVAELCGIRQEIQNIQKDLKTDEDVLDPINMNKVIPLYIDYCLIGLINDRKYLYPIKPFLRKKLENLSWLNIYNIYEKLFQKSNLYFFFRLSLQTKVQNREIIK